VALSAGVLLDTHSLIWLRSGKLAARPEVLEILEQASIDAEWFVSSISLSEIAHAVMRKRLTFDRPLLDWFHQALRYPGPRVLEITPEIAAATLQLPENFHGDPGDRILAATAIIENLALCTHDDALLRFGKLGIFTTLKISEIKE
jgi:PIN domain nuclease of toxin-antitoxin system